MARFVHEAIAEFGARLATWHGGTMRNAIPFECEVVLTLPKENVEALKENVEEWRKLFNYEFRTIEENIQFFTEDVEDSGFRDSRRFTGQPARRYLRLSQRRAAHDSVIPVCH